MRYSTRIIISLYNLLYCHLILESTGLFRIDIIIGMRLNRLMQVGQ